MQAGFICSIGCDNKAIKLNPVKQIPAGLSWCLKETTLRGRKRVLKAELKGRAFFGAEDHGVEGVSGGLWLSSCSRQGSGVTLCCSGIHPMEPWKLMGMEMAQLVRAARSAGLVVPDINISIGSYNLLFSFQILHLQNGRKKKSSSNPTCVLKIQLREKAVKIHWAFTATQSIFQKEKLLVVTMISDPVISDSFLPPTHNGSKARCTALLGKCFQGVYTLREEVF